MGQEKIILDMALGDGYITKPRSVNGNCCLVLKHSAKQTEYLLYKKALLEENGFVCSLDSYIDTNGYAVIQLRTSKKELITRVRNKLYVNGKKQLSVDTLNGFDAKSLAILYQDDGSRELAKWHRSAHGKYAVKPYINCFVLNMQCFDLEQLNLFRNILFDMRIESRIGNRKGHAILISKKESKDRFITLVKPYICRSMDYKINIPVCFHGIP